MQVSYRLVDALVPYARNTRTHSDQQIEKLKDSIRAAAETVGRIAHGLELNPAYVDIVLRRWQDFTGRTARLDGDGRSFDEIARTRA